MSLGNKEKKNIKKLAKSVTHKVSMAMNNVPVFNKTAVREFGKRKINCQEGLTISWLKNFLLCLKKKLILRN